MLRGMNEYGNLHLTFKHSGCVCLFGSFCISSRLLMFDIYL
ncbi:hypothetical protein MIMGU_mgv1a021900mg [Erythranthe guttata]|uniref:Uncharacterized protein n=1 Tax=Erythranthe guttata TaxID=4155 RepID=A0A022Q9Y0_ERYGU|nr:hypothetical protein MIMGU_mgv1a021900mg [Erythranthe guttata]